MFFLILIRVIKCLFQMSEIPMAGLLVPLLMPNAYSAQEYVPVPLTGVQVKVQVVNFVAQLSYSRDRVHIALIKPDFSRLKSYKSTKIRKRILLRLLISFLLKRKQQLQNARQILMEKVLLPRSLRKLNHKRYSMRPLKRIKQPSY